MSRIGKLPVEIPSGVTVTIDNTTVTVKGPLGSLTRTFDGTMIIEQQENKVHVSCANNLKKTQALHGLTRALLKNMVDGVSKGFEKILIVNGVGYKVVAKAPGQLEFSVGYSHTVPVTAPQGITLKVLTPEEMAAKGIEKELIGKVTAVSVVGIDKELVGHVAADIKRIRIPDPYHHYGIRYKDEVLVKKEGKVAGK